MKGFIEVTGLNSDHKIIINTQDIVIVEGCRDYRKICFRRNVCSINVLETYEEIKQKIKQAQGEK